MMFGKSAMNPTGWTHAELRATVQALRDKYPEMVGISFYGASPGNRSQHNRLVDLRDTATLELIAFASDLSKEFWPDPTVKLKTDETRIQWSSNAQAHRRHSGATTSVGDCCRTSRPTSKTDDPSGGGASTAAAGRAATGGAPATLSGAERVPVLNPKRLPGAGLEVLDRTPLGILGDFKPDIVRCKNGDLLVMAATCAGGLSALDSSDYNASNPENGYCYKNWPKNALFRSKGACHCLVEKHTSIIFCPADTGF